MSTPDRPAALEGQLLQLFAPAKINLALHVLGRRDDGYHELDSLFFRLKWGDRLRVRLWPARQPEVVCRCPQQPELAGADNLAARAALSWLSARQISARVEIELEKAVWTAAGLGGGSSDAAAVLRGLEACLGQGAGPGPMLPELALALGADVPFFLDPRPSRVRGIGEQLTPLEGRGPERVDVTLVNPNRPLSTPEVFRALGLKRGARLDRSAPPALPLALPSTIESLAALVHNDLKRPATVLCPEIVAMCQALDEAGAIGSGLSGSGPTVFGLFPTPLDAAQAAETCSTIHGFSAISTQLAVA
ncbi:MAG: 4-(cytidine 5'-diphospho)-2-C-methyl-D-erythritol kinase [Proteobacteria bacterium]|nr:MAG: 4-(cytidine 5'-diphospho)-2-C-methyl-D-erythritol kinase [Pseudomonadota bacterium]PIE17702.1 MAG: 4-(cytidine 5'-diphospho)-2-C-methyl-D-erythritol kinase [Pseudomonadota bacterium]